MKQNAHVADCAVDRDLTCAVEIDLLRKRTLLKRSANLRGRTPLQAVQLEMKETILPKERRTPTVLKMNHDKALLCPVLGPL